MNTKIRCLLLDDDLTGLTYLKILCEQIDELEVIKAFNSPEVLLAEWQLLDFDLLITDIEMPGINGLQLADIIKGKAIIFTTAYKNFAVDAFDRDVVDYVIKPIKPERLLQAVQKVSAHLLKPKQTPKQIQLNTDKGKALIAISRIFCVITSLVDSRDKMLFLNDASKIVVKNISFERLLEMLPQREFCRINKKTLLALKHVQYYSHDEITADVINSDGKNFIFSLSEIYRNDFIRRVKV